MDPFALPPFVGQLIVVGQQVLVLRVLKKNGSTGTVKSATAIFENAVAYVGVPPRYTLLAPASSTRELTLARARVPVFPSGAGPVAACARRGSSGSSASRPE